MSKKQFNLIGGRFGKLVVVALSQQQIDTDGQKRKLWDCVCDCGNTKIAKTHDLLAGRVKSCGCMQHISHNRTHNLSDTRIYHIWIGIKQRCNNPNTTEYKNYGGRGIGICQEWNTNFMSFYDWAMSNGYDDTLTIDRINNNLGYFPENCRWVTIREQNRNKRNSRLITYNGMTLTPSEWSFLLGGSINLVAGRIRNGWDEIKAITTPPTIGRRRNVKAT